MLFRQSIVWLIDWSLDWSIVWLIDRLIDWLSDWLIDWLIGVWLIDWLILLFNVALLAFFAPVDWLFFVTLLIFLLGCRSSIFCRKIIGKIAGRQSHSSHHRRNTEEDLGRDESSLPSTSHLSGAIATSPENRLSRTTPRSAYGHRRGGTCPHWFSSGRKIFFPSEMPRKIFFLKKFFFLKIFFFLKKFFFSSQARSVFINGVIRTVTQKDTYQFLTKVLEICRLHFFDTMNYYLSVFPDSPDLSIDLRTLPYSWLQEEVISFRFPSFILLTRYKVISFSYSCQNYALSLSGLYNTWRTTNWSHFSTSASISPRPYPGSDQISPQRFFKFFWRI